MRKYLYIINASEVRAVTVPIRTLTATETKEMTEYMTNVASRQHGMALYDNSSVTLPPATGVGVSFDTDADRIKYIDKNRNIFHHAHVLISEEKPTSNYEIKLLIGEANEVKKEAVHEDGLAVEAIMAKDNVEVKTTQLKTGKRVQ